MKAIILSIDTSGLNELRRIQSNVIRRSYNMAIDGQSFQSINKQIPQELDGHLHRCGVQRGIDLSNTKKTMIFGGRKQFIRRCKGLISNEEWKEYRTQPLYSIGQANVKGNRKFRIDFETRKLIYKDSETYYEFDIPKLKSNWEVILEELSYKSNNKEIALTYQVGKDSVSIIYDEQKLRCYQNKYIKYKKKDGRYIGIDLNPDRIGIAIYNTSHKGSEVIHAEQYDLTSDDQNKRRNEISHIADTIYKLMAHYNVSRCGMEDLTIKSKDHNKGRRFNKKINFWIRTFILNKMKMICQLSGCIFCNINPAYSSFVGTLRNPNLGDCCGAAAEIARRCAYQKSEFYPSIIKSTTLVHRWKEMANVEYDSWIGLYKEFKIRHLGWRSPPCSSRSSDMGTWSKRLLIYPLNGVSI